MTWWSETYRKGGWDQYGKKSDIRIGSSRSSISPRIHWLQKRDHFTPKCREYLSITESFERTAFEEQSRPQIQYLLRDIVSVRTDNNDAVLVIQVKETRFEDWRNIQCDTGRVSGAKPLKDFLDKLLVSASKEEGTPTPWVASSFSLFTHPLNLPSRHP